jgi:hypothetical protein
MKLVKVLIVLLMFGLSACNDFKNVEPFIATSTIINQSIAETSKPVLIAPVNRPEEKKEDIKKGNSAGKGEMKEVCNEKVKNGKTVLDKDGKPKLECRIVKVRQKLEATEIPSNK